MSDFVAELLEVQERERPEKVAFREVSGEVTFGALAAGGWRLGGVVAARVPGGGVGGLRRSVLGLLRVVIERGKDVRERM